MHRNALQDSEVPQSSETPKITPGLILSGLSQARLQELSAQLNMSLVMAVDEAHSASAMAVRLLTMLTDEELRKVCQQVDVPDHGRFMDLYRRLSLLC